MQSGHYIYIRSNRDKVVSEHGCFDFIKFLLLSHWLRSGAVFLILQQQNHLTLIRALLRNERMPKNLLDEKLPSWFLSQDAKIDFVHKPFFRQFLITACLIATGIRVSRNKTRNMLGIIDMSIRYKNLIKFLFSTLDWMIMKIRKQNKERMEKQTIRFDGICQYEIA